MADGAPKPPMDATEHVKAAAAGLGAGAGVGGAGSEMAGRSRDEGSDDREPRTTQELAATVLMPDGKHKRLQ